MSKNRDPEMVVREIKRRTRRKFSAEEKIRIVLEGLRGEDTIAEIWRRDGIRFNLYYTWSKEFPEAGNRRLMGYTKREATSSEVLWLKRENQDLQEMVADLSLKTRYLKKNLTGRDDAPDEL